MKQINLKSADTIAAPKRKGSNISLVLGTAVLVLSLILYGGAYYMTDKTKRQISDTEQQIQQIKGDMDTAEYLELYDFQDRLAEIDRIIGQKEVISNRLNMISAKTLSEVQFENYKEDVEGENVQVTVEMRAPNYEVISRQLDAYTQLEGVTDVSLSNSRLHQQAGIAATIKMFFPATLGDKSNDAETENTE